MSNTQYALAKYPTPILNNPHIPFRFPLARDNQNRLFEIETIAFPGTKFCLLSTSGDIAEVKTEEYASSNPLYVDRRFLEPCGPATPERRIHLPPLESILFSMERLQGLRYFWGGNWNQGIPELLEFYPPQTSLDPESHLDWTCTGVDCSGILYEATHGWTPRNTSGLCNLGSLIATHEQPLDTILALVDRGDMIVWPGHVIFVLSPHLVLESRISKGVIETPLKARLEECWEKKNPFTIRRWHPDALVCG